MVHDRFLDNLRRPRCTDLHAARPPPRPQDSSSVSGLSFIKLFIVSLPPRGVLNLRPGRYAIRCAVCNAVQKVADSDNSYKCWQRHQPTILHTVDDADAQGRHTLECPTCTKKAKILGQGSRYICSCGSRNNLAIYV